MDDEQLNVVSRAVQPASSPHSFDDVDHPTEATHRIASMMGIGTQTSPVFNSEITGNSGVMPMNLMQPIEPIESMEPIMRMEQIMPLDQMTQMEPMTPMVSMLPMQSMDPMYTDRPPRPTSFDPLPGLRQNSALQTEKPIVVDSLKYQTDTIVYDSTEPKIIRFDYGPSIQRKILYPIDVSK